MLTVDDAPLKQLKPGCSDMEDILLPIEQPPFLYCWTPKDGGSWYISVAIESEVILELCNNGTQWIIPHDKLQKPDMP